MYTWVQKKFKKRDYIMANKSNNTKNRITIFTVIFMLMFSSSVFAIPWQIQMVTVPPPPGEVMNEMSLVLDSNKNPHIAYTVKNTGAGNFLEYAYFDGSSWHFKKLLLPTNYRRFYSPALALDHSENPHIVYVYKEPTGKYNLKHISFPAAELTLPGPVTVTLDIITDVGDYNSVPCCDLEWNSKPSLVIDASGTLHITFTDVTDNSLKYITSTNGNWSVPVHVDSIPSGERGVIAASSLVLDSHNNPHVSYYYRNYSSNKNEIRYTYFDGGVWKNPPEILDSAFAYYTSLALDTSNKPHIVYAWTGDLRYAYKDNNNKWNYRWVDNYQAMGQYRANLALDTNGNPYVSYETHSNLTGVHRLTYAYSFDKGSTWYKEEVDDGLVNNTLVLEVLDAVDGKLIVKPHIAYTDRTLQLKYAVGTHFKR